MLTKLGYDSYTRCKDERNLSYQYLYSEIADDVREKISTRFPAIDFCIFEAFMLNEFLDVPLSKNCIVLQVEKDKSAKIFNFLTEEDQYRGLKKVPAIVKEMSDDEAIIKMVDANIQREEILPSERAFSFKMKMEAMKRRGYRSDLDSNEDGNGTA